MRKALYAADIERDRDRLISNIIRMYNLASDDDLAAGRDWYDRARSFCQTLADNYDRSLADIAAIMSVLSPATSFEQNVIDTINVMAYADNEQPVSTYGDQYLKALAIRDHGVAPDDVLGECKTAAFFINIVNSRTAGRVTVDRHSARVAVDWNMSSDDAYYYTNTPKKYSVMESIYQAAADKIGLLPHVLQAITWITYRRLFARQTNGDQALAAKRDQAAEHNIDDLPF